MKLPVELLQQVAGTIEGTCNSVDEVLCSMDLEGYDAEEVEEQLLDLNLERCQGCDWWMESCELATDEDNPGFCEDCL